MQGSEWARNSGDAALPEAFRRFGHAGSGRVCLGRLRPSCGSGEERGGRWDRLKREPSPSAFLRKGATGARPRRLRVHYERAGRSFYSATAAGGAKMRPAQIAEAQRMVREWKPK
jgi:hypothetical protein